MIGKLVSINYEFACKIIPDTYTNECIRYRIQGM